MEREKLYAIIEGPRGGGGRVLRLFTSATACLTAFAAHYDSRTAHFTRVRS